jgi:flavin reductase (NADH)
MSDTEQQRLLFRDAMANLPAAVNIVTTCGEAGRCGITATAVCSVTDTPPTLMVCINRNSAMNPVFERNGKMCINVLSHAQEEMARHFAGMTDVAMEQRFALEGWHEGALGQPAYCARRWRAWKGRFVKSGVLAPTLFICWRFAISARSGKAMV